MNDLVQIRLSGTGGQGLITAGVILAEAALLDGRNVVQTQTYGPEARLGSSKAEVIISTGPIAYPQVTVPDVLLVMSPEAARRYMPHVHAGTTVVIDSTRIVDPVPCEGRVHRLAITDAATRAGGVVVANTVALRVMNELCGLVSPATLVRSVLARVPEKFRGLNEAALEAGAELVRAAAAAPRLNSEAPRPTPVGG